MLLGGISCDLLGSPLGTNRVLIISATFKDRAAPETQANLQKNFITNAGTFFYACSYGDCAISPLSANGSKFIAITLPETRSFYLDQSSYPGYLSGSKKLRRDAFDEVRVAGVNPSDFDFKAICFEDCRSAEPKWDYWGLSIDAQTVAGTFYPAATLFNGHFSANLSTHEFGHSLSLHHAGCWMSKTSNPIDTGSNVDKKAYGDRFDMMGNCSVQYSGNGWGGGIEHYNIFYKQKLGWIRSQDWVEVPAGSSATYRLYANDMSNARGGSRLLALKIPKPSNSDRTYWLGHRQLFNNQWLTNGVQVYFRQSGIISDPGGQADTALIDMTPGSATRNVGANGDFKQDPDMNDSALVIGRTFSDLTDNIHVTPIGRGTQNIGGIDVNWIDVVVNRDVTGNRAPNVNFSGNPAIGTVNEPLTFTANASDPDGDTLAYYWDFSSDGGATWNKDFQSTNSAATVRSWSDTGNQSRVRVTVSDRKGGIATAVHSVSIISGPTPPTITTQPASQTVASGQSVAFLVAANPISGTTYQWRKNANNIASATGASYAIANVQTADAGNYTVAVSDAWHSVTSSVAVLTVTEVESAPNRPPLLSPIPNRTVYAGSALILTNVAYDPNPADTLTFSLDPGAPASASVHPTSGVFAWTPADADTNSIHDITVRVTDNGTPPMSATAVFSVTVIPPLPPNHSPLLFPVENRTAHAGSLVTLTNLAYDPDPQDTLAFSLDAGAPTDAVIDPVSGVFQWIPNDADSNTTRHITIRVTDDGDPPMSAAANFTVAVQPRPTLQILFVSAAGITMSWDSIPGVKYRLLYKDDLALPAWQSLGPDFTATNATVIFSDNAFGGSPCRFYRVSVLD